MFEQSAEDSDVLSRQITTTQPPAVRQLSSLITHAILFQFSGWRPPGDDGEPSCPERSETHELSGAGGSGGRAELCAELRGTGPPPGPLSRDRRAGGTAAPLHPLRAQEGNSSQQPAASVRREIQPLPQSTGRHRPPGEITSSRQGITSSPRAALHDS